VLYLPQYHPELNAIEYACAQVKSMASYGPTYNLKKMKDEILPQCFNIVTPDRAAKVFRHVEKVKTELVEKYGTVENITQNAQANNAANDADYEEDDHEYTDRLLRV